VRDLSTEASDPALAALDQLPTAEVVRAVVRGHGEVLAAVAAVEDAVARLAEQVAERMDRGGRVIYAGAGTGGRVALLDAAEWGPTFSVPDGAVIALVAGAEHPPGSAQEAAAEDDAEAGAAAVLASGVAPARPLRPDTEGALGPRLLGAGAVRPLRAGAEGSLGGTPRGPSPKWSLGPDDTVVGVSASGRTPYVLGAVEAARAAGALTAAVTSHPGSRLAALVDVAIEVPVGPEVIAGSTRLKAGTAQKLVLNAFSTAVMVRRGRTLGNLMVGMRVANEKLRGRATGVCVAATGCTEAEVSLVRRTDATEARRLLNATGGAVRAALDLP
jgi:N-acetylmuramic acid 6-phosphate etherase